MNTSETILCGNCSAPDVILILLWFIVSSKCFFVCSCQSICLCPFCVVVLLVFSNLILVVQFSVPSPDISLGVPVWVSIFFLSFGRFVLYYCPDVASVSCNLFGPLCTEDVQVKIFVHSLMLVVGSFILW